MKKEKAKLKRILSKAKVEVKLKDFKAPSILSDPNRFFKNELEETKRSMFL